MTGMIPVMKPWFDEAEVEAAAEAIRSGWVAQGPRVAEFETEFAAMVKAPAAVAVSSCTTGLHLVLHALDVGPGDEVVVPSLSFIATANAPRYVGATPVFCDVDPITQNVTAETVEAVMTDRTRVVLAVHQVGMPAELEDLRKLCAARDVVLVEDAACAVGSTYGGEPIGAAPALAIFSFHPRKLLTTGEGGMVTTADTELADRMVRLRQHGMSVNAYARHTTAGVLMESYSETGFNYRLTDIQAAIGLVQLAKIPAMVERRRLLADRYAEALSDVEGLILPGDPMNGTTNYQSYSVILTERFPVGRDDLMQRLQAAGISTRRGVMAAHREPAFAGVPVEPLTNTEYLTDNSIILPLFHQMTEADIEQVATAVAAASS
jgi:perosamine synthetase